MYLERLGLRTVGVEEVLPDPRGNESDPFRSGIPYICGICGIRSRACNARITEDAVRELSADLRTDAVHLCVAPPQIGISVELCSDTRRAALGRACSRNRHHDDKDQDTERMRD